MIVTVGQLQRLIEEAVQSLFNKPTQQDILSAQQSAGQTVWVKPNLSEESAEIKRTAKALGLNTMAIKKAAATAALETLDDGTWSKLENSDSFKTNTLEKALRLAKKYNRDITSVIRGLGKSLPASIVLFAPNRAPYLVGGNTRLMAARAFGINPKILAVRL